MMKTICLIAVRLADTGVLKRPAHAIRETEQTRTTRIKHEPLLRAASVRPNETIFNEQLTWEGGIASYRDESGQRLGVGFQAKQYVSVERRGRSSHRYLFNEIPPYLGVGTCYCNLITICLSSTRQEHPQVLISFMMCAVFALEQ